jgi:hypothetical protein
MPMPMFGCTGQMLGFVITDEHLKLDTCKRRCFLRYRISRFIIFQCGLGRRNFIAGEIKNPKRTALEFVW